MSCLYLLCVFSYTSPRFNFNQQYFNTSIRASVIEKWCLIASAMVIAPKPIEPFQRAICLVRRENLLLPKEKNFTTRARLKALMSLAQVFLLLRFREIFGKSPTILA